MHVTILPFVQQNMIRYGMTTYLALGIVGNFFNCIIFTRKLHRRNPSSIYFLSLSIFAIIHLIWSIAPLIYTLDHTDPQTTSILYCKIRLYGSHTLGQYLRYVLVLACIDRFVITRTSVRIRSLHSVHIAIKLIFIVSILCALIAIHIPILIDIRGGACQMIGLYKLLYAIYQITIVGILPPVLMIIFSVLTIVSLNQRHGTRVHARQRDRYLMRMVVAEVIVNIITSIPYSCNLIYGAATFYVVGKSAERLEIESFITFLTQFLIYFIGVAPFYLFIFISKPFRDEFINLLITYWNKCTSKQIRIVPSTERNITTALNGTMTRNKS